MKEAEPKNPCANCETKPCINNPYNTDGECWNHDTQEVSFIEIASKIADKIAEHTDEYE